MPPGVEIAPGTLAETPWRQVEAFGPDTVLHLAWVATPGAYLTSPENEVWLEQSTAWFQRLQAMEVPHIAGTGTCIEYAASSLPLQETISPLGPGFPYSRAKAALFEWLRDSGGGTASSWNWFRVFYLYGPGEHSKRICSSLITQLRAGRRLELRTPHSVKDYIFIDDLALAICQSLEARVQGAVNVGSGAGIAIQDLATRLAQLLHADPALVQQAAELDRDPYPVIIADNQRLRSLGWSPRVSLDEGLQRLIDSLPAST